jgi:hypothetical protein
LSFVGGVALVVLLLAVGYAMLNGGRLPLAIPGLGTAEITSVLEQDRQANTGAQSVADVVRRMRAIDLNGCPDDFRVAYHKHIEAWEMMASVEANVRAFQNQNDPASVVVESFVRGFLADPFGKANELKAAQNQLQREYQDALRQVHATWDEVEDSAARHGAKLPQKQASAPPKTDEPQWTTTIYPLQIGTTWTYQVEKQEIRARVARYERVAGVVCSVVEWQSNGKVNLTDYVAVQATGVYRYRLDDQPVDPPDLILKVPVKHNDQWKGNSFEANFQAYACEVEVPAGKYKAVLVEMKTAGAKGPDSALKVWYADNVGIVKQVIPTAGGTREFDLVRFESGGKR